MKYCLCHASALVGWACCVIGGFCFFGVFKTANSKNGLPGNLSFSAACLISMDVGMSVCYSLFPQQLVIAANYADTAATTNPPLLLPEKLLKCSRVQACFGVYDVSTSADQLGYTQQDFHLVI